MTPDPYDAESVPDLGLSDVSSLEKIANAIFSEGLEGFPAGFGSPTSLFPNQVGPEGLGPARHVVSDAHALQAP